MTIPVIVVRKGRQFIVYPFLYEHTNYPEHYQLHGYQWMEIKDGELVRPDGDTSLLDTPEICIRAIERYLLAEEERYVCCICDAREDVLKCPIMTGVPFSAPPKEQRYVCHNCFDAWRDGAGTTREGIRKARGLDPE